MRRAGALALCLAACGDVAPAAPVDAGPLALSVGTGSDGWVDLPEGGVVTLFHGSQGGIHVLARVRFTGLAGDVRAGFAVVDPATGARLTGNDPPRRRLAGSGLRPYAGGYESAFAELVIFASNDAAAVRGRALRLDVTVAETARPERAVSASRAFVPMD